MVENRIPNIISEILQKIMSNVQCENEKLGPTEPPKLVLNLYWICSVFQHIYSHPVKTGVWLGVVKPKNRSLECLVRRWFCKFNKGTNTNRTIYGSFTISLSFAGNLYSFNTIDAYENYILLWIFEIS